MRLDTRTWALIPLAVAINVAAGSVAAWFRVPLYLDSLGTILVASLAGPAAGALTGAISNTVFAALTNPIWLAFLPVAAVIGGLAGGLARRGFMGSPALAALAGLLVGVVAATLSAPLSAWLFGGTTGGGTDLVVVLFRSLGLDRLEASLAQSLATDPLDKMVSFLVVQPILAALPRQLRGGFPQGRALGEMRSFSLPGRRGSEREHGERRAVVLAGAPSGLFCPGQGLLHRLAPLTKVLLVLTSALAAVTLPVGFVTVCRTSWLAVPFAPWLARAELALVCAWREVPLPESLVSNFEVPLLTLPLLASVLLCLALTSGLGLELGRATAALAAPLVLSMVSINGLFGGSATAAWGPFRWSTPAALEAVGLSLRILVILQSVVLLLLTTRPDLLMADLERRGLPHRLAYVLLASLHLVPTMLRRAGEILEAQTARGMPLGRGVTARLRALVPISGPLLMGAVSEVEERALALEARGFGARPRRTYLSDPPGTCWDPLIQVALILALVALGARFLP